MQTKNAEGEEVKLQITLAGEVYYFLVATFVSIYIVCSMLSSNINILSAIAMITAIWATPFIVVTITNLIKFIFVQKIAREYGKKE